MNFCLDLGGPMTPVGPWSLARPLLSISEKHVSPWLFFTSSAIPILPSVLPLGNMTGVPNLLHFVVL